MKRTKEVTRSQDTKNQDSKQCTTCLQLLPLSNFYSKGKRRDSICKNCKKQKSKATYLRDKKVIPQKELNRFIQLMKELELKALDDLENKMIQLINERKKDGCNKHRSSKKVA